MRKVFYIIFSISILLSCNRSEHFVYEPDLKFHPKYDLVVEMFNYFDSVKTKNDTIRFLKFNKEFYNENCMVFSKKDTNIDFYFNVCECELYGDTLKIQLWHIKGQEALNLSATEFLKSIQINIHNRDYKILYTAILSPNNKKEVKIDTLNIRFGDLILSEKNFSTGKQIIGNLIVQTEQDSVFGNFTCFIDSPRKIEENEKEITEEEIYRLTNQVYIPYCRDSSKIKNIIDIPYNGFLGHGMQKMVDSYLSKVERLSEEEIEFLNNQVFQEHEDYSYGFRLDTTWKWTKSLHNSKIIPTKDYLEVKDAPLFKGGFELFKERFGNCVVLLSKPLISQGRDIFIINERYDNSDWCGTGKERTLVFKKINNKWEPRLIFYW